MRAAEESTSVARGGDGNGETVEGDTKALGVKKGNEVEGRVSAVPLIASLVGGRIVKANKCESNASRTEGLRPKEGTVDAIASNSGTRPVFNTTTTGAPHSVASSLRNNTLWLRPFVSMVTGAANRR